MKKLIVELGMMVRMHKYVVVEVPNEFDRTNEKDIDEVMHDIYNADEGNAFEEDDSGTPEEAGHYLNSIVEDDNDEKTQFIWKGRGDVVNLGLIPNDEE